MAQNRLFIELYLDEDVNILVADLIRAHGFDVLTTREAAHLGARDEEQLDYAASQHKAILTHNRVDFEALHQRYIVASKHHEGIIIATRHSPHEVARRLLLILNAVTADEIADQLRYI